MTDDALTAEEAAALLAEMGDIDDGELMTQLRDLVRTCADFLWPEGLPEIQPWQRDIIIERLRQRFHGDAA